MNKQELIEQIKGLKNLFGNKAEYIEIDAAIKLIEQLDEPQKTVVPQFVADWLKYCKCTGVELQHALNMEDLYFYNYANQKDDLKLKEFFETENNQDIFARAWLDGYEVEEKRYLVSLRNGQPLVKTPLGKDFYFNQNILAEKYKATRKELEQASFGWVFDCEGIEVKEVK